MREYPKELEEVWEAEEKLYREGEKMSLEEYASYLNEVAKKLLDEKKIKSRRALKV